MRPSQCLDHRQIPLHRCQVMRGPTGRICRVQIRFRGNVLLNGLKISLLHRLV